MVSLQYFKCKKKKIQSRPHSEFHCTYSIALVALIKKQLFKLLKSQINYEFSNKQQFLTFATNFIFSYLNLIKLITHIWYVLGKNIGPVLVRSGRTRPANLGVRSCPGWTLICPVRLSPIMSYVVSEVKSSLFLSMKKKFKVQISKFNLNNLKKIL